MLVHVCRGGETDVVPAVVELVGFIIGLGVFDHGSDFLEIVLEGFSVGFPGAVDGGLVVLWDAGWAPCICDEVV